MRRRTCSFSFSPVTVKEIEGIVSKLRGSKATGLDFIDVKYVKAVSQEISPCLTHIINLSIETNTFPDVYKHAKVVPLLKSQDKSPLECSSYRPVALLPVLSRVVEKALFTQLSNYLEQTVYCTQITTEAANGTIQQLLSFSCMMNGWQQQKRA